MSGVESYLDSLQSKIKELQGEENRSVALFGGPDTSRPFSDPDDYDSIDALLDQASSEMTKGQLIHPEHFSLAEAMSCLEIMDPKMDSGMALRINPTFTAEESFRAGIIPLDNTLSISEIILIMDRMFQAEVGFYGGHNLIQTIFTCLYLHDLRQLSNPYLITYLYATIRSCGLVREMVMCTDISDEEDFNGMHYGFRMLEELTNDELISMITMAERDLNEKINKAKTPDNAAFSHVEALQDDSDKEIEFCEALLARLRLKRAFFMAQIEFEKDSAKGKTSAKKNITLARKQLQIISDSHETSCSHATLREEVFEPAITRRILFTAPPNTFTLPSFEECITLMETVLDEAMEFCGWDRFNTLPTLLQQLEKFSRKTPNIISRARLYRLFFNGEKIWGRYSIVDLVKEDMLRYGINNDDFENEETGVLLDHMSHIFMMYCHSQFRNRSRQRGKLMMCFQELGIIQGRAEILDLRIYKKITGMDKPTKENPDPMRIMFSNYIIEFTFRVMIQFIKQGLELELYNSHEYPVVYWYLDFLYGRWSAVKSSTMNFLYEQKLKNALKANAELAKNSRKKKKVKKAKNIKKKIEPPTQSPDHIFIETQQSLCRALARLITGLHAKNSNGKDLGRPKFEFGSDNLRFFQRFGPFHHLRVPPCLWYSHFEASMNLEENKPQQVIEYAAEVFGFAKKCLDKLVKANLNEDDEAELKALTRIALTNQINILRLGPGPVLHYNFDLHACFPVITYEAK